MKRLVPTSLIAAALTLTGCAASEDYARYSEAMQAHSTSEASRIKTQSASIASIISNTRTATPTEKVLLAVIGMMQIERLQPSQLKMKAPTTWADVMDHNVSPALQFLTTGAIGYFVSDTIQELATTGGNRFYGDVSATGAFNNSELHQTYSTGTTATISPWSVEPEVVYPEVIEVGGE